MTSFERCTSEEAATIGWMATMETPAYADLHGPNVAALDAYECWRIVFDGKSAGTVILKGNEIHMAVRKWAWKRWASRAFYRFMEKHVQERGVLRAHCGNPRAMPFIRQLEKRGFICVV